MNTVYFDNPCSDDDRRAEVFKGQIFVFSPRETTLALCRFARELIEEAFAPHDPVQAQHFMPTEQYADILNQLKPLFINHAESKRLLQRVLREVGCEPETTYFDMPRMRTSTSDGYLTTGIAYAWHPHRDTWYSAPPCQLNWWIPVYDITSENAMAFHPVYWGKPIKNSSSLYNYYEWNQKHRGAHVASYVKQDPRPLPRAVEPVQVDPQLRICCPVGGVIVFSGAQLHSSVPNTSGVTRFSVDFRTVNRRDAELGAGAPNVDAECTGTTMRDYLRVADLERLPEDLVAMYDDGTAISRSGDLIYKPSL